MADIKVSVIMPVYNVSKYLHNTMESVINQTLRDIEIICVDDGSTDGSRDILEEYSLKDDRIKVIKQDNLFAGVARNNGFEVAKGEYVVFWDSDDLFHLDALEKMYSAAVKDQAQIVVCGADQYDEQLDEYIMTNTYLREDFLPEECPFSKSDIPGYIFNFATNVPWNKMYLRRFITEYDLKFEPRRKANDTYFVLMAFYYADRISLVREPLMAYRVSNRGGITKNTTGVPFCAYDSYVVVLEELKKKPDFEGDLERSFINRALSGFMFSMSNQNSFEDYKAVYEKLRDEGFDRFGISDKPSEYFYYPKHYYNYTLMADHKPEDFLLNVWQRREEELKVKRSRLKKLRIKKDELKDKKNALKGRLSESNKRVKEQDEILNGRFVRFGLRLKKMFTIGGKLGSR